MYFTANNISYNQVCGKIIAYQFGSPDAFGQHPQGYGEPKSNNDNYIDGVSLTYGRNQNTKHIWSFAGAIDEVGTFPFDNCPCTNVRKKSQATDPPSFTGNDYFCDTASVNRYQNNHLYK